MALFASEQSSIGNSLDGTPLIGSIARHGGKHQTATWEVVNNAYQNFYRGGLPAGFGSGTISPCLSYNS